MGSCLPSSSCFFFAYLLTKKINIKAKIKVVKNILKFSQTGAGVYRPLIVINEDPNNKLASSGIGNALNAAKYQKKI